MYQIYDKMFKKILTLSSKAVINLINGLFDTDYPADSTITYNWTEFENNELKRILADTIITVNGCHGYHIEAQMTKDDDIVFRMFDYGYAHGARNKSSTEGRYILTFPEPKIIYFVTKGSVPERYEMTVSFGTQGSFCYRVPVFNYLGTSPAELNRKKMVILIPFELLRLREEMKKERTPENLERLKNLIKNDIIGSIEANYQAGNITLEDNLRLKELTHRLYLYIYGDYEGMEDITQMTDESLMLDIDIIEKQHEEEIAKITEEKDNAIAEKEQEIAALKKQLEKLQNCSK
jgi:hypothetical protein